MTISKEQAEILLIMFEETYSLYDERQSIAREIFRNYPEFFYKYQALYEVVNFLELE
jgi:hypothetical protein